MVVVFVRLIDTIPPPLFNYPQPTQISPLQLAPSSLFTRLLPPPDLADREVCYQSPIRTMTTPSPPPPAPQATTSKFKWPSQHPTAPCFPYFTNPLSNPLSQPKQIYMHPTVRHPNPCPNGTSPKTRIVRPEFAGTDHLNTTTITLATNKQTQQQLSQLTLSNPRHIDSSNYRIQTLAPPPPPGYLNHNYYHPMTPPPPMD